MPKLTDLDLDLMADGVSGDLPAIAAQRLMQWEDLGRAVLDTDESGPITDGEIAEWVRVILAGIYYTNG